MNRTDRQPELETVSFGEHLHPQYCASDGLKGRVNLDSELILLDPRRFPLIAALRTCCQRGKYNESSNPHMPCGILHGWSSFAAGSKTWDISNILHKRAVYRNYILPHCITLYFSIFGVDFPVSNHQRSSWMPPVSILSRVKLQNWTTHNSPPSISTEAGSKIKKSVAVPPTAFVVAVQEWHDWDWPSN